MDQHYPVYDGKLKKKFRWEVSLPKAAMIWWQDRKTFNDTPQNEPIVGNDVSPQDGTETASRESSQVVGCD